MLTQRKKLKKKQIKEDKLVTTIAEAKDFYEENQNVIFGVVGAIALIVFAVIFYVNKVEEDNLAATAQLSKVLPIYNSGAYQEAIDGRDGTDILGLASIVDNYSGSEQGEVARLYLANSYYFLGNIDLALENYQSYSGSDQNLNAAALAGSAGCYEASKNYSEAGELFEKAAAMNEFNPMNPEYLLFAGINYFNADEKGNSERVLQRIKDEYKTTQFSSQADRYLAAIK